MLAAILLNLADYQQPQRDADAGKRYVDEKDIARKQNIKKAVSAFANLLDKADNATTKPLRKLKQRVINYSRDTLPVDDFSELIRELSMREFELRRSLLQVDQQEPITVLILEQLTIILTFMQDDEEAIIALLLG